MGRETCSLGSTPGQSPSRPLEIIAELLAAADIQLNGSRPWDMQIFSADVADRILAQANLGLGEAYMDGLWECERLDQFFDRVLRARLDQRIKPGMRVLDIGCGWGSFMSYAAEHYGVQCIGVTISKEQTCWIQQRYQHLNLDVRLQDYREVNERFDRIVSVGMFEHVGRRNHRTYMQVAERCLEDHGLFLLHTIGKNKRHSTTDPWIDRYIFPNGDLPNIGQIGDAAAELFVTEDLHNFGADYDHTLMAWHANFEAAWPRFRDQLGERFYRMWRYYLLSCAGAFRARDIQLWQWVFSRHGIVGGYPRIS